MPRIQAFYGEGQHLKTEDIYLWSILCAMSALCKKTSCDYLQLLLFFGHYSSKLDTAGDVIRILLEIP